MVHCRYVGNDACEVGDREFDAIGQVAVFSEQTFADVIRGGGAFIADKDFQKIGITAEEIAAYGHAEGREIASASFNCKVDMAQQVFRDTKALLSSEGLAANVVSDVSESDTTVVEI